jgi:hypothetical protein
VILMQVTFMPLPPSPDIYNVCTTCGTFYITLSD